MLESTEVSAVPAEVVDAKTRHSRKMVDHYSFLDLARIHLHRRTQSQNGSFRVLRSLLSATLFCFNERT